MAQFNVSKALYQVGRVAGIQASLLPPALCRTSFNCLIRPIPNSLFTQDPGFWKSVHTAGDAWEEQVAQHKAVAAAEAAGKVVVKDVHFHGLPGTGDKAAAQVGCGWCGCVVRMLSCWISVVRVRCSLSLQQYLVSENTCVLMGKSCLLCKLLCAG